MAGLQEAKNPIAPAVGEMEIQLSLMKGTRVLLADDHTLLLGALEKLLSEECDVVGQVSDGRALVAAAEQLKPDVIVLDISMPILNGVEAARQIKQKLRNVKLVFLTMNEDPDLAAEAFRAGASAYLRWPPPVPLAIRGSDAGRSYDAAGDRAGDLLQPEPARLRWYTATTRSAAAAG